MFDKFKSTVNSREFQTGAGQVAIAVVSILAANVVSGLVAKGLNTQLNNLMDKIHGTIETPAE